MPDDPRRRQDAAPAGLDQKEGGDHDVSTDVSPPAQTPGQPDYSGGKFDDAARPDRATDRPGGMGGEG